MRITIERYFEMTQPGGSTNTYMKESVTWQETVPSDPRGVELDGEVGKYFWVVASNTAVILPANTDPSYWDYYNLPPISTIVREMDQTEYDSIMATRADELRALKRPTPE